MAGRLHGGRSHTVIAVQPALHHTDGDSLALYLNHSSILLRLSGPGLFTLYSSKVSCNFQL